MAVQPTVFVVDDDAAICRLLRAELEPSGFQVRCFLSAETFLAEYADRGPACALLDLRLADMSGIEVLQALRSRQIGLPVIMISAFADVETAVSSMKLGAQDFIQKPFEHAELIAKITRVLESDAARREREGQIQGARRRLSSLTSREMQFLKALAMGKSSKMIATELDISPKTADKHRANILRKTGAENTADLVRIVAIAGLLS